MRSLRYLVEWHDRNYLVNAEAKRTKIRMEIPPRTGFIVSVKYIDCPRDDQVGDWFDGVGHTLGFLREQGGDVR